MKRWDELTEKEQNNLSTGMANIAKIKMMQHRVHEDLTNLYKVLEWTDTHHATLQILDRHQARLTRELEQVIWEEIKSCNGCIHLELTALARIKNKNSGSAEVCIRNIQIFANQITEITQ